MVNRTCYLRDLDIRVYTNRDVMTLDTKKTLLSISEPLQLTMHYGIKDETVASLGQALQS